MMIADVYFFYPFGRMSNAIRQGEIGPDFALISSIV
jgi:hypothetical protein